MADHDHWVLICKSIPEPNNQSIDGVSVVHCVLPASALPNCAAQCLHRCLTVRKRAIGQGKGTDTKLGGGEAEQVPRAGGAQWGQADSGWGGRDRSTD